MASSDPSMKRREANKMNGSPNTDKHHFLQEASSPLLNSSHLYSVNREELHTTGSRYNPLYLQDLMDSNNRQFSPFVVLYLFFKRYFYYISRIVFICDIHVFNLFFVICLFISLL